MALSNFEPTPTCYITDLYLFSTALPQSLPEAKAFLPPGYRVVSVLSDSKAGWASITAVHSTATSFLCSELWQRLTITVSNKMEV